MKYFSKATLFLALVSISWVGCKKSAALKDNTLQHVPGDVSAVTMIDVPAILKKADFENVKKMEFYQEVVQEAKRENAIVGEVVADPSKSGVDLDKPMYMVYDIDPDNPEMIFTAFVTTLKDAAAFKNLVGLNPELKMAAGEGYEMGSYRNEVVAWNDNMAVIGTLAGYGDPTIMVKRYFSTTPENSIAKNSSLGDVLGGGHDISSWFTTNALAKGEQVKMILPMAGFPADALENNYLSSYVDFKDGEIVSRSNFDLQKGLTADFDLLFKNKVKTDFSSVMPSENNNMVMTVALDFEGLQTVLNKRPQAAMLEYGLQEYGISFQDITSTFGGDIMVSINTVDNSPVMTFATNIIDKSKILKFLQIGAQMGAIQPAGDNRYSLVGTRYSGPARTAEDAEMIIKDNMIVISGSPAFLNTIMASGFSSGEAQANSKKISGNIFGLYADFNSFMKLMDEDEAVDLSIDDLILTSERKQSDFKMNFKDKSANSLKQLFQSINKIYLKEKSAY